MIEILTFQAAGELWAVPLASVHEVVKVADVTRLPLTPASVAGIIDVHGSAMPAIDFATLAGTGRSTQASAIVLEDRQACLSALLVESIRDVTRAHVDSGSPRRFIWSDGVAGEATVIDPHRLLEAVE